MNFPAESKSISKPRSFSLVAGGNHRITWSWFGRQCRFLALLLCWGSVSYWTVSHCIGQSVRVEGVSMSPTLPDAGCYWLNRLAYTFAKPQPDDIVAVKDPRDNVLLVKRIIGTPGEKISIINSRVYVNGQLLHESYLLPNTPTYAYKKSANEFLWLGTDEFFVMGDNRGNSEDSRVFGPVPRQDILGKVVQ